jgi:hypothetical protein
MLPVCLGWAGSNMVPEQGDLSLLSTSNILPPTTMNLVGTLNMEKLVANYSIKKS